jgi:hypothetical protein
MDTAQTIFDRVVRVACGFESLHVRDGAVPFSTAHRRVYLYARFDLRRKAKKDPIGIFFACFS